MLIDATTLTGATKVLEKIRRYSPYRYGGKWFIFRHNDYCHCHRSKSYIFKKAKKLGIYNLEWCEYGE